MFCSGALSGSLQRGGHVREFEQVADEDLGPGLAQRLRAFVVPPHERAQGEVSG